MLRNTLLALAVISIATTALARETEYQSGVISKTGSATPSACTSAAAGDICAADDVTAGDDVAVTDDLTVGDDATITGDVAISGTLNGATFGILEGIRFCGNGNDGATAHYLGPVPLDDTEADLATGGAGCDGLDNATIGTVDAAWPRSPNVAFKAVGLMCNGICTGGTAANDAITVTLYDDTVASTDLTCSFTFAGDATANQCTVADSSPATVAAGSLLAIGVAGTDDVCDDAGDDFECILFVTY